MDAYLLSVSAQLSARVDIRDRRHRFRVYRAVFLGSEAVSALISLKLAASREDAVRLGQQLVRAVLTFPCTLCTDNGFASSQLEAGLIQSVFDKPLFVDGYSFYRFSVGGLLVRETGPEYKTASSTSSSSSSSPTAQDGAEVTD